MNSKYAHYLKSILVLFSILLAVFIGWGLGNIFKYYWTERIAFYSRRDGNLEVYTMLIDGSGQTRLTINDVDDGAVAISHDGHWIAFDSSRDGNYEVYKMKINGQEQTRLTNDVSLDSEPAWSPDNRKIAFESTWNCQQGVQIFVMNADGTDATPLTECGAYHDLYPSWSSDGSQIVFCSNRDGNCEIYIMDADGDNQQNITNSLTFDGSPEWSPVGNQIAFNSDRDGNMEIYVMNSDGSNVIRLTDNSATDGNPHWSFDGTWIFFQSDRDGNQEIYRMDSNGENVIRLTYNETEDLLSP